MGHPRGIFKCKVAGKDRTLRKSLNACIEIEDRLNAGIDDAIDALQQPGSKKFKTVVVVFEELCRAGGTPLTEEDLADLVTDDIPEIQEAITQCFAQGAAAEAAQEDPKGKKGATRKRS